MANFQAAAAEAMKNAVQGMQGTIPGLNIQALSSTGGNYNDTITALAMQQAAAQAAGQQLNFQAANPFMNPMMAAAAWQQQNAAPAAPPQQQPQPPAQS